MANPTPSPQSSPPPPDELRYVLRRLVRPPLEWADVMGFAVMATFTTLPGVPAKPLAESDAQVVLLRCFVDIVRGFTLEMLWAGFAQESCGVRPGYDRFTEWRKDVFEPATGAASDVGLNARQQAVRKLWRNAQREEPWPDPAALRHDIAHAYEKAGVYWEPRSEDWKDAMQEAAAEILAGRGKVYKGRTGLRIDWRGLRDKLKAEAARGRKPKMPVQSLEDDPEDENAKSRKPDAESPAAVRAALAARVRLPTRSRAVSIVRRHAESLLIGEVSLRELARSERCDVAALSRAWDKEKNAIQLQLRA